MKTVTKLGIGAFLLVLLTVLLLLWQVYAQKQAIERLKKAALQAKHDAKAAEDMKAQEALEKLAVKADEKVIAAIKQSTDTEAALKEALKKIGMSL